MNESMIERVARAICAEWGDAYDEQPLDMQTLREQRAAEGTYVYSGDPGLPTQDDWKNMARAGMAAMRKPTADMRDATRIYLMDDAGNPVCDSECDRLINDIIDAAIAN